MGSQRGIRGNGYEAHGVTAVSGTELHRATAGSGARREVMLCDDSHSTSGTMVCSLQSASVTYSARVMWPTSATP